MSQFHSIARFVLYLRKKLNARLIASEHPRKLYGHVQFGIRYDKRKFRVNDILRSNQ